MCLMYTAFMCITAQECLNSQKTEHHGVFIDSRHYVSYIRQSNKWYHCDDKHITETNLLTLSNNVYLMFYAKEVDLDT